MHCSIFRGDGAHTHTLYNQHATWHVSITIFAVKGLSGSELPSTCICTGFQFWFVPKSFHRLFIWAPWKCDTIPNKKTFKIRPNDDNSMGLGGSPSKFSGQPVWVAWTLKPPWVAPSGNPSHGSHGGPAVGGHGAFAEHLAARVHHGWPGSGGTICDPADWRSPPMGWQVE